METLPNTRGDEAAEEVVNGMFQHDTLLAYDYFTTFQRKVPLEPEKTLMLAVLEEAISTFRLYALVKNGRKRKLFLDAQRWLWQPGDSWPFCFENICEVLGFDADYLRAGLNRWKKRQLEAATEIVEVPGATDIARRAA